MDDLKQQLLNLPQRVYIGANRYDTDATHVLHLWDVDGKSFDIITPKGSGPSEDPRIKEIIRVLKEPSPSAYTPGWKRADHYAGQLLKILRIVQ